MSEFDDGVRGQHDCAVAVPARAVDDTEEFASTETPYGEGRVLLAGGKWAVMIEEILPQADEMTVELDSWKTRMEMDDLGETLGAKEGSG